MFNVGLKNIGSNITKWFTSLFNKKLELNKTPINSAGVIKPKLNCDIVKAIMIAINSQGSTFEKEAEKYNVSTTTIQRAYDKKTYKQCHNGL